jgi:hypothetical protein
MQHTEKNFKQRGTTTPASLFCLTVMVGTDDKVLFVPYGIFLIYYHPIHLFYST